MEFVMRISKIIIGVAVVVIGLGIAFKDTIQPHMYAYMHSSIHKSHSANGMGHDIKNMPGLRGANASQAESNACLAFAVRMRRKLNLTSLRSCLKTSTI